MAAKKFPSSLILTLKYTEPTSVPAKQCEKCGDIVVNDIILERLKKYAHDYPSRNLDYAKYEEEESAASQILF